MALKGEPQAGTEPKGEPQLRRPKNPPGQCQTGLRPTLVWLRLRRRRRGSPRVAAARAVAPCANTSRPSLACTAPRPQMTPPPSWPAWRT